MAFTNRLSTVVPGMGTPLSNDSLFYQSGVSLSGTTQQSTTLPSSGSFAAPNTLSKGYLRIKIYSGGGTSPTLTDLVVTATDGTTTVTMGQFLIHPSTAFALASNAVFDDMQPFLLDINATSFTVKTTLGGTTPTASMDVEVSGTL